MKVNQLRLKILDKPQVGKDPAFTDAELQGFIKAASGNLPLAAANALTKLANEHERLERWAASYTTINYDRIRKDIVEVAREFHNQGMAEATDETMTLDELIEWLRKRCEWASERAEEKYNAKNDLGEKLCVGMGQAYLNTRNHIKDNREALELGMQKPLRFKRISSGFNSFWVWVDEMGEPHIHKYNHDWLIAIGAKENVEHLCEKLGATVIFTEEDPDEPANSDT